MLVKGKLGNLIGGISQQQPQLRLPTQSADEVNTWPVIVDGNCKRPPTEYLGTLPTQLSNDAFTHFIIRDETERYAMSISNGAISVVDLNGNVKTVSMPDGSGYLTTPGGILDADNFSAVTIADYTFIVNKSVVTQLTPDVFPTRLPEALVNVMAGNYARTYTVTITRTSDGAAYNGSYTTKSGATAGDDYDTATTNIVTQMGTNLNNSAGGLGNGWGIAIAANTIFIQNKAGIDFSISSDDGQSSTAMVALKGQVQDFAKLPLTCYTDMVFAVVGDASLSAASTYYVQYTKSSPTQMASNGVFTGGAWKECPQPGVQTTFDANTMPHVLVRNADGTFTFQKASWNNRLAGDEITIPKPSFIGQAINAVDFYSNRLGFYAGGNVIWSRSGDYFNFWRTSAIELQDDDPIDLNASTSRVSILRAGTPYQQGLIIWSDLDQFSFSGSNNELVTPKTSGINEVTPYENLAAHMAPVATPRRIFFGVDRNAYVGIKEWYYDVFYHIGQSDDCTAHVPTLIPNGAFRMVNSTIEDCLVVSSRGDRSSLWAYKYYWQQQDKLQSSWVRWNFPGAVILNTEFINSELYLLVNRGSQTSLEKMRLYPDLKDTGGVSVTYLDRRIGSDAMPAASYDVASDTTTYTLPYTPATDGTFSAVTRTNGAASMFRSQAVSSVSGTTVRLTGNTTALLLYFGERYTSSYTFSPIFMRDPAQQEAVQEGKLQVLKMDVAYSEAGYFRAEVTPPGRSTYHYEFDAWSIGDDLPDVDSLSLREGVFTFPVRSNGEFVNIKLINDSFLPCRFIRVEWKANFVPKSRK